MYLFIQIALQYRLLNGISKYFRTLKGIWTNSKRFIFVFISRAQQPVQQQQQHR